MKTIEAFKTKDGKVFTDKTEATAHEAELIATEKLVEILKSEDIYIGRDSTTSLEDIAKAILKNSNKIIKILFSEKK